MGFEKLANEVNFGFKNIIIFFTLLRAIIVFLISFLIVITIGLSWIVALIPTIIYLVTLYKKNNSINKFKEIEMRYPELNERLRTAVDNLDESNMFVYDLHLDVAKLIKEVRMSEFFNKERAKKDIFVIAFLSIIIILIAPLNIHLFDLSLDSGVEQWNLPSILNKIYKDVIGYGEGEGGIGENEDIYGKKSIAMLGNKEIEIQISSSNSEIDIRNIKDVQPATFEAAYPQEITAVGAQSFQEQIPRDQQELVKNYYKNIAEVQ